MSSNSVRNKHEELIESNLQEEFLNINTIIIPFASLCKPQQFIYHGEERIAFSDRHPIFQNILKKEFIIEDFKSF